MTDWRTRHATAMAMPRGAAERRMVKLVGLASDLADEFATDYVLRDAVADVIRAGRTLLNAELGRLDGGTLESEFWRLAAKIKFDLDLDKFEDERTDEERDRMPATYRVVRRFFEDNQPSEVVETGLTLDEAQAHCQDPETSSRTATGKYAVALTESAGPWFDGYERE